MKRIIIISILLFAGMAANAQAKFNYTYDDNGNRVLRKFDNPAPSSPAPHNDTIIKVDTVNAQIIMPDASQNNADSTGIAGNENKTESNKSVYESALGERKISIYPNPTKGELRVDISNYNPESKGTIYIVDMHGKVVFQSTNITASNLIDISNTARTTYVLRIVLDGKAKEWVVVKQ